MPSLFIVAGVTLVLMVATVIAAFLAARPRDDGLEALRDVAYSDSSLAAVDAPVSSRPPFDPEGLRAAAQGDDRLMAAIIDDFLGQVPDINAGVRMALDLGDARALARCAQSLRNAAGPLGAEPLLRSVAQLEKAAGTDITLAWRAADVFDRDLDRLCQALERTRGELGAPIA